MPNWIFCTVVSDRITGLAMNSTEILVGGRSQRMTFTEHHRRDLLDKIEHLVQTKFYDPNFKGRNWKSIVENHRAEILSAAETEEFERSVNNMCSELASSGLGLISAQTRITPKNSIS